MEFNLQYRDPFKRPRSELNDRNCELLHHINWYTGGLMFKNNPGYFACVFALGLSTVSALALAVDNLSAKDKQFITKAAQAGHAEVAAGKIAAGKSTSDEVKKFGDQMVQDHGKAGDELSAIAKTKGVTPPSEPDAAHKKMA